MNKNNNNGLSKEVRMAILDVLKFAKQCPTYAKQTRRGKANHAKRKTTGIAIPL